jgi:predicted membrane protein
VKDLRGKSRSGAALGAMLAITFHWAVVLGPFSAVPLASFVGSLAAVLIGTAAAMMSLIYIIGLIITPFAGPETREMPLLS